MFVVGKDDKLEMRGDCGDELAGNQWIVEEGLHVGDRV